MKDVILFYDCNFILLTWSRAFVSTDDIVGGNQYDSLIYNDDFEQETIQWKLSELVNQQLDHWMLMNKQN